ncbi:MAG: RhuM family protein [Alphaproteobacteria bacterium]
MNPVPEEPVQLFEDAETGDRFLIYGTNKGIRVELRYDGETLWMTQAQLASLYGVDRSVVTKHLANIYEDGELDEVATSAKIAQVRKEGSREVTRQVEHYNLDAIISVGYRVNSREGTLVRKWATEKLVQFATKGFVVDAERLKRPGNQDRVAELREIIRDIRADEANVYREIRSICAMCKDYDGKSDAWHEFYARVQAKLMWAVTSNTPSEVIMYRANADHPNMGLRTWRGDEVTKADSEVAKNYLVEHEIKELNRLTTILLDVFEDQLELGKISTMVEIESLLDSQLKQLNRTVLRHGGVVKTKKAKEHAQAQYKAFNEKRRLARHAQADAALAALKAQAKSLPKARKSRTTG